MFYYTPKSLTIKIFVILTGNECIKSWELAIQLHPVYANTSHRYSDSGVLEKIQDVEYNSFNCLILVDCPEWSKWSPNIICW